VVETAQPGWAPRIELSVKPENRAGATRAALPTIVFGIASIVSVATILSLVAHFTFWGDEWDFWLNPPVAPSDYFIPRNEHWSTVPYLIYRGVGASFGLRSYLPFMAPLLIAHVACAAGILMLGRASWLATGIAVLVLFLGSGGEDLLWGWQVGFVLASALGVWAFVMLERGRVKTAAGLLFVGVMTAGIELAFLGAAVIYLLARRDRRVAWLGAPAAAYVIWYLAFGRSSIAAIQDPFTASSLLATPGFAAQGIVFALGGITGLNLAGVLTIPAFVRRIDPLVVAAVAGILIEYVLIGLVRSHVGESSSVPRYVYPAAALLAIAVVRQRPRWPRITTAALGVAIAVNVGALILHGWPWSRLTVSDPFGCIAERSIDNLIIRAQPGLFAIPDAFRCEADPPEHQ